jgi:hypothetical protein
MDSWCLARSTELPSGTTRVGETTTRTGSLINAADHAETDDHGTCSLPRHTIRERID